VNTYKQTATVTAIVALCASFAFWTHHLDWVPLPHISDQLVDVFDDVMKKFKTPKQKTVSVLEVEVESLGGHFTEQSITTQLTASVIPNSVAIVEEKLETETEPAPEPAPVIEEVVRENVQAAAPTELEQWELKRAWSIAVPALGIRAPVMLPSLKYWSSQAWELMEEQMQVGLNHGTVAYPHSSGPGGNGSLIIAGHSSPPTLSAEQSIYGDVFARLPEIEVGQEITITTNASPITYRVEEKMIVSPKVTSILEQQTDDSILKLITCYPVGTTTSRMIIIAKKIEK
jgi:LPXTG-site transpeptidase (sortase) family protein